MHAVVAKVNVTEGEPATKYLREEIVPRVAQAPGLVAAYWVFGSNPGVSLIDVSVGEVVANA